MHSAALHWMKTHVPELPPKVVEIGGADVNASLRVLYAWSDYRCVDIADGPGVDIVMPFVDWAKLTPADEYDLVASCEVLEHTPTWPEIIREAHRILKPGGKFIGTCAHVGRTPHSAYGYPELPDGEFYANVPASALADVFMQTGWLEYTVDVARYALDLRWTATK